MIDINYIVLDTDMVLCNVKSCLYQLIDKLTYNLQVVFETIINQSRISYLFCVTIKYISNNVLM